MTLDEFLQMSIERKAKLISLSLASNHLGRLTAEQWELLNLALIQCPMLTSLSLWNCHLHELTEQQWTFLSQALGNCEKLIALDIGANSLNKLWKRNVLSEMLEKCPELVSLSLEANNLGAFEVWQWDVLGQALKLSSKLLMLDLSQNNLYKFAESFPNPPYDHLIEPYRSYVSYGGEGFWAFGRMLSQCLTLQSLNLRNNDFNAFQEPKYWRYLGRALIQCPTLESLDFTQNGLGRLLDEPQTAFSEMIAQCPNLTFLSLRHNYSSNLVQARYLLVRLDSMLKKKKTLLEIGFDDNGLCEEEINIIRPLLDSISLLTNVNVFVSSILERRILELNSAKEKSSNLVLEDFTSPSDELSAPLDISTQLTEDLPVISEREFNAMVSLLGGSELPKEANQLTLPDDSTIPEERASLTSSHAAVPFIEDETSIVLMQQEMQDLKKQMSILSLSGSSFSEDDRCIIYMMLAQHKQNQILLIERETIRNTPTHEAYYGDIQRRFSALMVAAQGIGAGYIDVSNSTTATVSGWAIGAIAAAISIAFPPAALVAPGAASALTNGVNILDARYRKEYLKKISIFGVTITQAEVLGEQVARLLTRAHLHAKHALSTGQAERDSIAMIHAIVSGKPIPRDEKTAEKILRGIWGSATYCIDPLPVTGTTWRKAPSTNALGGDSSTLLSKQGAFPLPKEERGASSKISGNMGSPPQAGMY